MFYETHLPARSDNQVSALVVLTPSESKRLIAKSIAKLPEVKKALEKGLVIITRGTTNTFVAEEIIGITIEPKSEYCRGYIGYGGELCVNLKRGADDFVLRRGKVDNIRPQDAIKEFTNDDIFIKGASAVDSSGEAGVLAASSEAGTVGYALLTLTARGAHLIVPVGLEKLVPSVAEAIRKCSVFRFKYSFGSPCSLIPLINARVVTEIQALAVLAGVSVTHVASGGIGGSEGAVVLSLEGNEANVEQAFNLVKSIKGQPGVPNPERTTPPAAELKYDPAALRNTLTRR